MTTGHKLKMVFTGSIGAGKTTAISTISEVPPVSTDVKSSETSVSLLKRTTTVAMDYGELTLEDGSKLLLCGTPGQRRFDFMSSILTKGALGLIVLIDNMHPNPLDELDYYLNINAPFLLHHPAVIGVTHFDKSSTPSIHDYHCALAERGESWVVVPADVRKPDDVALLLELMVDYITAYQINSNDLETR